MAVDLGTLSGNASDHSLAYAINERGQIVGESQTASDVTHAFLFENGVMIDLGTFESGHSLALDINDLGQIVGRSVKSGVLHAALWDKKEMIDLGVGEARAINNRGQILIDHDTLWEKGVTTPLGSFSANAINDQGQLAGSTGGVAAVWENGVVTTIGTLGGSSSRASGINNRGQVAGWSNTATTPYQLNHAFLWPDENGEMIDLGVLPNIPYGTYSVAEAINGQGLVVGMSGVPAGYPYFGFLYRNGEMTQLPTLGGITAWAYDVNARRQVVGTSSTTSTSPTHATLWAPTRY